MGLSDLLGLFDGEIVQSYINFATQDGTVHDFGSYLLMYGPVLIGLLLLVIAYQLSAMTVTGLWRSVRGLLAAGRYVARRGQYVRSGAAGTGAGTGPAVELPVAVAVAAPVAATAGALPAQPVGIKRTPARVA